MFSYRAGKQLPKQIIGRPIPHEKQSLELLELEPGGARELVDINPQRTYAF
jgi:hypothetical protein